MTLVTTGMLATHPAAAHLSSLLVNVLQPAAAGITAMVETGHVRLDIQQRRAIQDVHVFKAQQARLASDQANHADPDRIRTAWRPRGEDAVRRVIKKRFHDRLRRGSLVEPVDQEDV